MVRLQATIDESVGDILDLLKRRNDKSRFIELAIKLAYTTDSIRSQFVWKSNDDITPEAINKNNKKIEFDKDFD